MYLEVRNSGFRSVLRMSQVILTQRSNTVVGYGSGRKWTLRKVYAGALEVEVSRTARGGKMPDSILQGLSYACVTVVLDNRDGFIKQAAKEIRVERHIYRSGDSGSTKTDGKKSPFEDVMISLWILDWGEFFLYYFSRKGWKEIFNFPKPEREDRLFLGSLGVLKFRTSQKSRI